MGLFQIARPIWGVDKPEGPIDFANGVTLDVVPGWVSQFAGLGPADERALEESNAAMVVSYEFPPIGLRPIELVDASQKAARARAQESLTFAQLALWISWPRAYRVAFTAEGEARDGSVVPLQATWSNPSWGHQRDPNRAPNAAALALAARMHRALVAVPSAHVVSTALAATWSALHEGIPTVRLLLLWIAMESLFGPDDAREMSFRLAQRVALFHAMESGPDPEQTFALVKAGYSLRSKVAHGRIRWNEPLDEETWKAECLLRESFRRIVSSDSMIDSFGGKRREAFLDALAFTRGESSEIS